MNYSLQTLVKNITENSTCILDELHALKLQSILKENSSLPITLNNKVLAFKDYTIGELKIGDLTINIAPRNEAFTLTSFFQILQFIDRPLLEELSGHGFEESNTPFNLKNISKNFWFSVAQLMQFGATGYYQNKLEQGFQVHGAINFNNYIPQLIPHHGIQSTLIEHSINSNANQIIKSALTRLTLLEDPVNNTEKFQILRELKNVEDKFFSTYDIDKTISSLSSSNPHYVICLELAKKILHDLQLIYKNGQVEWLAFLENSNEIFEKYILKILDVSLPVKVEKWNEPKNYAVLEGGTKSGIKSFSPDILLNYDKKTGKALAVLDAKNKKFEPSKKYHLNDVVSPSDLYQLIFYCKQLKTRLGGLIYPSSTSNEPIRLIVDSEDNLDLYLFSVNMKEDMRTRHNKLVTDVTACILVNS